MRWLTIIVALIAITGLLGESALAQTLDDGRFFPETGHSVSGAFLEKYSSIPNGEEIYGYPITDAFNDQTRGHLVQYFEKARFELHPEAPSDLLVQITHLGEFLYEAGEALPELSNFASCKSFLETTYRICYDFLDFFEANGGVTQFGYPISDFEIHDGWISQYFQRARFEWHPERPPGEKVFVSNLGIEYFHFSGEDPRYLRPWLNSNIAIKEVSALQVHAFVSNPILPLIGNNQELYVIVYDQDFRLLANVFLNYTITLPDGQIIKDVMGQTNQSGLSVERLYIRSDSLGTAKITVTATFGTIQRQTRSSFQIW
ncbi:MAG: hypothetical protein FJ010_09595 [Chloroflexi bacterium]|nr:hypothetical protein [Chloroflexota bacterium]